jgi:hypothetical protein
MATAYPKIIRLIGIYIKELTVSDQSAWLKFF